MRNQYSKKISVFNEISCMASHILVLNYAELKLELCYKCSVFSQKVLSYVGKHIPPHLCIFWIYKKKNRVQHAIGFAGAGHFLMPSQLYFAYYFKFF